jgi:hypothetical protein
MKAQRRILVAGFLSMLAATLAHAQALPAGYGPATLASGTTSDYLNISQMAFEPGDPSHLYAIRFAFGDPSAVLTRYDYSSVTGKITNPTNLITTGLAGAQGLAFFNNNLYISTSTSSTGGILYLAGNPNGTFAAPVEFVNNIPVGEHQVGKLQVQGNSLYAAIGTQTDNGDKTVESVYNGTVARIADLRLANTSAAGANDIALSQVLGSNDPSKLLVFASGFRNPYGLGFSRTGNLWVADNGQDSPVTPDLLYKNVAKGSQGLFPTNDPGTPITPLTSLGNHSAGTGLAFIPTGADQGNVLVGLFHGNTDPSIPLTGNDVALVNSTTGAVEDSITSLTSVTDILVDPTSNRILIADYGPNFDNNNNPNSGGIFELSPQVQVPEPSTAILLLSGVALTSLAVRSRSRGRA